MQQCHFYCGPRALTLVVLLHICLSLPNGTHFSFLLFKQPYASHFSTYQLRAALLFYVIGTPFSQLPVLSHCLFSSFPHHRLIRTFIRVLGWRQREKASSQAAGSLQCPGKASCQRIRSFATELRFNPDANNRCGKINFLPLH